MRLGVHLPVADSGDGLPTAAALRDHVLAAATPASTPWRATTTCGGGARVPPHLPR